ncbi:dynein heavy chain, putative [Plasmodium malariae]|uniref:Dynein heavy chain, putative n=1 Tax=Plasmodium malariae TaxID=5858 RepID=A0A1C3KCP4_PLAMA|nr:dynein heavy chain, putative [Plasmodium malariae]
MTKFSEHNYDALNLTELKSNIQEQNIIGYSVDYTVSGLLFFGGFKINVEENNGSICNDAYLIHINKDQVEYENIISKIKPTVRCYHSSCSFLENYVLIFGGLNSEVPFIALNDLWIFNSLNKTFVEIKLICKDKCEDGNVHDGEIEIYRNGNINELDNNCTSIEEDDYEDDDDDDNNDNDSILDNINVKNLKKYLRYYNHNNSNSNSSNINNSISNTNNNSSNANNSSGEGQVNNVPSPRYYSSLDLYIVRKSNIENTQEESKKEEISVKNNKILVNNASTYEYFSLIVFGGYGGYDRSSYNDLYEYNILNNEWLLRSCKGSIPFQRYGHISFINGNNLFILGGTNSEVSFNDMYSCNLKKSEWSEVDFSYSFNVSKVFCRSVLVESIDRNIIFIFGGYNIISDEKGNRKIEYNNIELNMLKLYDTFKLEELKYNVVKSKEGTKSSDSGPYDSITTTAQNKNGIMYGNNINHLIEGEKKKGERGDTGERDEKSEKSDMHEDVTPTNITFCSITYDFVDSNLIITDSKKKIYIMNISRIIGPKYAIFSLWPRYCDIDGNKKILVRGKGFNNEGKIVVKFKSGEVNLFSEGIYINENNIYTIAPNAKNKIKNNICDVQLSINDKCYTTNSCALEYYYNIDPKNTLIFGTGLLEPVCLKEENIFFLIARNSLNENKKIGGDKFQISIIYEQENESHSLKYSVYDVNNGFYIVKYFPFHEKKMEKMEERQIKLSNEKGEVVTGQVTTGVATGKTLTEVVTDEDSSNVGVMHESINKDRNNGTNTSAETLVESKDAINMIQIKGSDKENGNINTVDGTNNENVLSYKGTLRITVKIKEEDIQNSPFVLKVHKETQEKTTYVKNFVNNRLEDLIKKGECILDLIKNKNRNTNNLIELNVNIENFLNKFSKSIYDINIIEQYMLYGIIDINKMENILEELHRGGNIVDAFLEDESYIEKEIINLIHNERGKKKELGNDGGNVEGGCRSHGCDELNEHDRGDTSNIQSNPHEEKGIGSGTDPSAETKKTSQVKTDLGEQNYNGMIMSNLFLKIKENEKLIDFINENKLNFMDYVDSNLMKKLKNCILLLNNEELSLRNKKDNIKKNDGAADIKTATNERNRKERNGVESKTNYLYEEYLTQIDENKIEVIRNLLIFYYKLRSVCICKKEKELKEEFINEEKESIKKLKLNFNKFINIKKNLEISNVYIHNNGYEASLKELETTKNYLTEIKEEVTKVKQISDNIIKIDNVEELNKNIEDMNNEINEIEKLWMFIKKKEEILNGFLFSPFKDLDIEDFDMQVKKLQNNFKQIKVDRKHNICKEETIKLKETIKFISVLSELKKPFIKERHIKEIEYNINEEKEKNKEEKISILIDDNTLTIYFYKLNVMKYHDTIEEVIIKACNEKIIEETINKFEEYWDNIYFKNKNYKNDIILTYIEDVCIDTIEEHQVTLQNCFSSKYFLFFSTELNLWQKKISNIYEVIQLLKDIEKLWLYLQNMYVYSEEVKKELPLYSKFFLTINDEYLEMLKQINDNNTKVIVFSNEEGIVEKLEELKVKLCKSEKPLNEYLDSKRKSFPRFFFISSTDLIDILSNGNNFKLVNTHVQKIFLSIRRFVTKNEKLSEHEAENEVKLEVDKKSEKGCVNESREELKKEEQHMHMPDQKEQKFLEGTPSEVEGKKINISSEENETNRTEEEEVITKLISSYGEEICNFHEPLSLRGKVECYLNDIIGHIKYTLKYHITNLFKLKHLYNNEKEIWIDENYLSQVFILCNTIFFVNDVESILSKSDCTNIHEELKKYYKNHIVQLENVIKKVQKKLTIKNRIKIMCIITLDTFYRDILEVILKNKNAISINMFDWQSQIRIYPFFKNKKNDSDHTDMQKENTGSMAQEKAYNISQDGEECKTNDEMYKKDNNTLDFRELYIKIKIMDCSFNYSYDYIGNYQRLVITPLTSRIYITATQALSLYMGCAPAGPAGTGKTETTKDLSSFFGKNCYVFNCSDQLDYKSMGNIFKGIGSTGCWCCFDEFNRLIPEVLSVCSIQFKSILDCKRNNNNVCIIGSDEIIVKKNCAVFITMNPDYLGRSKLPESLKILFRPITVIIPDFNKICENMLMAEGYVEAKYLSIKFTTFFELAQSLLKEKHCDWGLRSIKSVLTKAGFLKRTYPNDDENKLLYSAIHDINIAKISSSNCPIFSGLLNDIFYPNQDTAREQKVGNDMVGYKNGEENVHSGIYSDVMKNDKEESSKTKTGKNGTNSTGGKEELKGDKTDKEAEWNDQDKTSSDNNIFTSGEGPKPGENEKDCFNINTIEKELTEICKKNHLFGLEYFVKKIIQLNDIINIRHCVFIMGEAGCGKTTLFNMLMEYQKRKNLKTVSIRINPKSINIDDLYGNVHIKTREWKDGVFSKYMRNYSKRDDCDKAYIIFDGNLDSHWIENMNSVMDDNKVLTLSSNERILLKNHMNLVFEFSDLMFATPATISRAGLVYFSVNPNDLWKNYFLSWIDKHHNFSSSIKKLFEKLMYKYVEPTFSYLSTLQTSIKVSPMSHIQSLSALLDILLIDNNFDSVEHYFIYSVIWCFGSFLGEKDNVNYKKCFDKYWKNTFKSIKVNRKISVFDFYVENNKFKEWDEVEINNQISENYLLKDDIFVETVESCSYKYITKLFLKSHMPILFIGKTGVGKTQLCKKILNEEKDEYKSFYMIFNYYTTSKNVQSLMQSCLEKKSGKQFSPPYQQKLIYFIDDINMPKCDDYNTQSAIELLCQYIDTNSWFDLEKLNLIKILNTKLISCMNYNRGNFTVNPRLLRHFFILNINFPENNTINSIFSVLLKGHFSNFKQDVSDLVPSILKSTISLFYNIEKTFKRTATYFYYEFNLRDIHSIVKGLLTTTPSTFQDCDKLLFLWLHECERVYSDKLNKKDKRKYKNIIIDIIKKMYNKYEINKLVMKYDNNNLLFSNFHKGSHDKSYDLCKNIEELTIFLTEELNEYNNFYNLNIVLFNDAIKHICKLIRIVDNLKSHALLLGIGGCGKTTISKFSSYISSKTFFEMDFSAHCTDNDIKKYLHDVFHKCAMKNEDIILFLKESKIHDKFFIYVNEYMCSNNIIDLYTKEEKDNIIHNMRNIAKSEGIEETDNNIFDYYIKKVNNNLHFILCFSPTSNNFRDKSNNFQCILNNTMIDIYDNWEADSLMCVGKNYVNNIYMNINTGDIIINDEYIKLMNQSKNENNIPSHSISPMDDRHTNLKNDPDENANTANSATDKMERLEHDLSKGSDHSGLIEGGDNTVAYSDNNECNKGNNDNKTNNNNGPKTTPVKIPNEEEYVNLKDIITEYLKECYEDLLDISSYYYSHERSHIYITPKLYLESIKTYHIMLLKNITNINNKMDMLKSGITKMNETSSNVENIKNCLKEKKKISEEKKEAAEKYAIDIGNEKMIVKKESDLADIEEKNCLEIQKTVLKQQEECENDIALGIPLIEQAEEALNTLNKKNIQELKTLNKPPPGVEDITAAVMQLLATIDTTICVDKFGKIKDRSWKSAQKMMINPEKFISLLKDYKNKIDENLVPDCNFKYVENLINLPHFNKNAIQKKSKAAAGLAEWVLNITSFYKIIQNILPKRILLDNTKKSLEEANEKLQIVREKVQSLKAKLSALINQYDHAIYERDLVILEEKKLKTKLELSIRLIDALSSEQISWSNQYQTLKKKKKTILTDILLSSTFVTFCGGFTKKYRNKIMTKCVDTLKKKNEIQNAIFNTMFKKLNIKVEKDESTLGNSKKYAYTNNKDADVNSAANTSVVTFTANNISLSNTNTDKNIENRDNIKNEEIIYDIFFVNNFNLDLLINEEILAKLSKQGLTLNSVCIENNIILENSEKFPIIIDPQMESLKWLINSQKEKSEKLVITDINDKMLLKKIEECISFGYSIIVENADEYIDNTLYNIISKNIIKKKNNYYININDKELIFHPSFYIILHTQLSNPHYQPEIQSACSLINFTVTPDDLEEHLLSITLENEFNHLSKKKKKLSLLKYDYMCQLSFLQSFILQKLTNAKGDILEDVSLIENLEKTKLLSENIAKKSEIVKNTEVHINTIINLYRPLSKRGVMYFFILQKLKNLHSFYFYSLEIFLKIFVKCLNDCSENKPFNGCSRNNNNNSNNSNRHEKNKYHKNVEKNPTQVNTYNASEGVAPKEKDSKKKDISIKNYDKVKSTREHVLEEGTDIKCEVEGECSQMVNEHISEEVGKKVEEKQTVAVEKEAKAKRDELNIDKVKFDYVKTDEVKTDEVKTDEVKTDEVKIDEVKFDDVKTDEVKTDEVKNDEVKNDEVKNDEVKNDEVKNDEVENDEVENEVENDQVKIDEVKIDSEKIEIEANEEKVELKVVKEKIESVESEDKTEHVKVEIVEPAEEAKEDPADEAKGETVSESKDEPVDAEKAETVSESKELVDEAKAEPIEETKEETISESNVEEKDEDTESEDFENDDFKNEEIKIDKNEVEKRVNMLINLLIVKMWMYIDKGLLERDKLIVKCLIMLNIEKLKDKITEEEEEIFINPKYKLNSNTYKIENKKENDNIEKKLMNKSFISEDLYEDCKNLENLKDFEKLTESFESESMSWKQWLLSEKVENEELPRKYNNLKDFSKLLLIRVLRKDRFLVALKNYIKKHIKMTNDEKNTYALENILEEYIDNKTPVLFLLTSGNDPSKDIEDYIAKLKMKQSAISSYNGAKESNDSSTNNNDEENKISYINISMGQGQESIALKYLKEISKSGGYIFLQNIHLMTKWLKEFEEILDKIFLDAHPNFRLFLSSAIPSEKDTQILPEKLLKKCFRINNEKSYSLKDNIKCCLDKFENKEYDDKLKTVIFGLSYYHSLLLGRFLYGKIGFSQSYSFNDNDLEISFNIIKRYLNSYQTFPLADVLFLIGEIIYGGHITDIWDRRINKTYVKNILMEIYRNIITINERKRSSIESVEGSRNNAISNRSRNSRRNEGNKESGHSDTSNDNSDISGNSSDLDNNGNDNDGMSNNDLEEKRILKNTKNNILFEVFKFPDCSRYNITQLKKYIDEKLNKEQTYLLGLHINAEIEYMKNECSRILQNLQELGNKEITSSENYKNKNEKGNRKKRLDANEEENEDEEDEKHSGGNKSTKIIYEIINNLLNELPEKIDINDLKIDDIQTCTFMVIALKEAEKFNILIECINDTLIEIKLVLEGILNMNDKIQNAIKSLLLHNIPEIWKNYSYPSKKKLMPWFDNFKLRIIFIKEWISKIRNNIFLPNSVWLSALFNPISFLTAIKQKFAHENRVPIDKLKLKWHVTNITKLEDLNNKNNSLYIHGLFLQGASWLINSKNDTFVFDKDNLNDNISYGNIIESVPKNIYFAMPLVYVYCVTNEQDELLKHNVESRSLNTPLYITSDRGSTFVCSIDLNLEIDDIEDKWILAGVALFLSDD